MKTASEGECRALARMAEAAPNLGRFSREMKREHRELRSSLVRYRKCLERLPHGKRVEAVRQQGERLLRALAEHMQAEEQGCRTVGRELQAAAVRQARQEWGDCERLNI